RQCEERGLIHDRAEDAIPPRADLAAFGRVFSSSPAAAPTMVARTRTGVRSLTNRFVGGVEMFSSRVVARAVCACLGFLFVAGSAQAQLESCPLPTLYPSVVLSTVGEAGDIDFGNLTQKVCDSIVKKGVATCRAQVKSAAKCAHKVAGSIFDIQVKQCAQM